jgi:hypothetical protein
MTPTRRSPTPDQVFAKVRTGGGHGGPLNVVIGRTGPGERVLELVEGSGFARAVRATLAATATHKAVVATSSLPPRPLTLLGYSALGADSVTERFFSEEANDDWVP